MAGLKFSVPYNNDLETLGELFKLKDTDGNRIHEVYLSGPQKYSAAGRIVEEMEEDKFVGLVEKIHQEKLRVNLIMNPTCEGTGWYREESVKQKLDFIGNMHEQHGVEAVTIANPIFLKKVRQRFPKLEIGASVLSDIDCVQRAEIFAKAGADVITPDVSINRDLGTLAQIKKETGVKLKIMVNEGCLYKCPFRKFHFNYISHKSKELGQIESDVFFFNCFQVTNDDHSQILKSGWIRPEDTSKYRDVCTYFKIVGRERPRSLVIRAVRAYLKETWDGDLLDILCSSLNKYGLDTGAHLDNKSLTREHFFERVMSCKHECVGCSYCRELANRLINLRVLTRGKLEDLGMSDLADQLERQGKLPP